MAYPAALRQRVLAHYDEGVKTKAIAAMLKVSPACCRRVKLHRGKPRPKIGGSRFKLDLPALLRLEQFVAEKSDATLEELRKRIADELNVTISIGALCDALRRRKLTLDKSR
jgi:transposase